MSLQYVDIIQMLFNQVEEGLENFSKDSGTEVNTNIDMERREIF